VYTCCIMDTFRYFININWLYFQIPCEIRCNYYSRFTLKRPRQRAVEQFVQSHTSNEWHSEVCVLETQLEFIPLIIVRLSTYKEITKKRPTVPWRYSSYTYHTSPSCKVWAEAQDETFCHGKEIWGEYGCGLWNWASTWISQAVPLL
jgi:hypothetical protein